MFLTLTIIHVIISVILIVVVLMQHGKQQGQDAPEHQLLLGMGHHIRQNAAQAIDHTHHKAAKGQPQEDLPPDGDLGLDQVLILVRDGA